MDTSRSSPDSAGEMRDEPAPYDELSEDDVYELQVENYALRDVCRNAVIALDAIANDLRRAIAGSETRDV